MVHTEVRPISRPERQTLEATLARPTLVSASDTAKWVVTWIAALCVFAVSAWFVASLSPGAAIGGVVAGVFLVAAIVCLYLAIAAVASYRRWRRVQRDEERVDSPQIRAALADGRVRVTTVRAVAVATIEEEEDEGAGFVFDTGDGKLFFVKGQRYQPVRHDAAWPNAEFEIVRTVLHDRWVGIFCKSQALEPIHVVAAGECRDDLVWAEREEIVDGTLEQFVRSICKS